jgi:neutral ceramidase
MNKILLVSSLSLFLLLHPGVNAGTRDFQEKVQGWKAGVATVVITPEKPIWMAGYAARNRPSEGTVHDLWAKALALEDADGSRAVIVTTDLIGFRGSYMSGRIRERIKNNYGLTDAQIILSSSHTHTGPELMRPPQDFTGREDPAGPFSVVHRERIREYSEKIENRIVNIVGEALSSLEPVDLFSGQGVTRFAVNRRFHRPKTTVNELTHELDGPVDHSVPIIKAQRKSGEILAVLFGYACHTTTTGIYEFTGDYAGFAQIELEKSFPGSTAMFFAGAGADQNPLPRNNIAFARQYGVSLAAAVESIITQPMQKLSPYLSTSFSKVDLGFADRPPTKEELQKVIAEASNYPGGAINFLHRLNQGESLPSSYPYPLQFWRLGEQNMVVMSSEVVVDYAIILKQIFGRDLFVMAYANEGMGYIPSTRVLNEGGYESDRSPNFTGPWAPDIEMKLILEIIRLAEQTVKMNGE